MNKLIILSGMSGVGKDTVAKSLLAQNRKIVRVKTYTTRSRRVEADGKLDDTYHYVDEAEFKKMISENKFLEWAVVHSWYYGSPIAEVERIWQENKIPLLIIDIQGLNSIQKIWPKRIISIFLKYDEKEDIRQRLIKSRPGISEQELDRRIASAQAERKAANNYQYHVVNPYGQPEQAAAQISHLLDNVNNSNPPIDR